MKGRECRMMMFTLTDSEIGQFNDFMQRHRKCCGGDFDGAFDFIFHPASDGMIKSVVCCWCGTGMDFVSYESYPEEEDGFDDGR